MAVVRFWGFLDGASDTSSGTRHEILSGSAIGMSAHNGSWGVVRRNSTARGMFIFEGNTSGAEMTTCIGCISYGSAADEFIYYQPGASTATHTSRTITGYNNNAPDAYKTIMVEFSHSVNGVACTPVSVWGSRDAAGNSAYAFGNMFMCEIRDTGGSDWTQATPDNKLSLVSRTSTARQHLFYIGISITPTSQAVGFDNNCYFQTSFTYA